MESVCSLSLHESPLCARHCVPLSSEYLPCFALTVLQEETVKWAEERDGGVRTREWRRG